MNNQLPYIIKTDERGHDVLVNNTNIISLNITNSSKEYQYLVYNNCQDNLAYDAYEVNKNDHIIKTYNPIDGSYVIDLYNQDKTNLYMGYNDNPINISYNSKYITVWDMDYDCPIINLLAAYDIENQRIIDCSNSIINQKLIDGVIKSRRCMFDVVASILKEQELMIDKTRLYSFMSFIVNDSVDQNNFHFYVQKVKSYILQTYPELNSMDIPHNNKDIINLNQKYGIDYFVFKKQDYDINDIKYVSNKAYIKK